MDIEGQATDSLRSLGICGGDTLWLMSAPQEAQQSSNSHLAESAAEQTLPSQAAMPSTATLDKAAPADSAQPNPNVATDPPSDVHMVRSCKVLAHGYSRFCCPSHAPLMPLETPLEMPLVPDGVSSIATAI